jgi:hypothetical protein
VDCLRVEDTSRGSNLSLDVKTEERFLVCRERDALHGTYKPRVENLRIGSSVIAPPVKVERRIERDVFDVMISTSAEIVVPIFTVPEHWLSVPNFFVHSACLQY